MYSKSVHHLYIDLQSKYLYCNRDPILWDPRIPLSLVIYCQGVAMCMCKCCPQLHTIYFLIASTVIYLPYYRSLLMFCYLKESCQGSSFLMLSSMPRWKVTLGRMGFNANSDREVYMRKCEDNRVTKLYEHGECSESGLKKGIMVKCVI